MVGGEGGLVAAAPCDTLRSGRRNMAQLYVGPKGRGTGMHGCLHPVNRTSARKPHSYPQTSRLHKGWDVRHRLQLIAPR